MNTSTKETKRPALNHPSWCVCEVCKRKTIGGTAIGRPGKSDRDNRTDAERQADGGW